MAALANGTLAYALDTESIHGPSITHAAAIVVPSVLAVAETTRSGGAAVLAAIVVGLDAADRISRAITPAAQYARGFHPSAIAGAPAAALAAANLLGLDQAAACRAVGIAATQAGGLMAWETDPSEQLRPLNCGIAARNGVTAALLAERGFGAPEDPLEGYGGMLVAFGDERSRAEILSEDLGSRFAVCETQIKRFPCCAFLQPGVEAVLDLQAAHSIRASDVDDISLHFPRGGAPIIDNNPLRSHCAQYVLAVALTDSGVTFDDIAHDRRADEPELAALTERVQVVHSDELDPEFPERYTSRVVVRMRGGPSFASQVSFPAGHPRRPLTDAELREKVARLAAPVVDDAAVDQIVGIVAKLEEMATIDPLMSLLRVTPSVTAQTR
jgi:2-methylcitrate dehydratase PrpD